MSHLLKVKKFLISLRLTNSLWVTNSMGKLLFFRSRVTSVKLINEKIFLNITVWMSLNPQKSIPLLRFLKTSYNSMSWGCPGTLKSSGGKDVVSSRWKSIRSFFTGCIPLGFIDIQVQNFNHMAFSLLQW